MFVEHEKREVFPSRESIQSPMKLSQAIRVGAMYRGQCTGTWFKDGRSCALGAAWEGLHGYGARQPEKPSDYGNSLMIALGAPPNLLGAITNLNDRSGWTREGIADWLESQGY